MKTEGAPGKTTALEWVKIAGLLLIEGIATNIVRGGSAPRISRLSSFRRMSHNLWIRMTISREERQEIEEALDLATSGSIQLPKEEYDKLHAKSLW